MFLVDIERDLDSQRVVTEKPEALFKKLFADKKTREAQYLSVRLEKVPVR